MPFAADLAPNPVVEPPVQIAGSRMSVAGAPAFQQHFANVGHIVAVGVPEKERLGRLMYDHTAAGKEQARWNAKLVRKHRELVGASVAVGILQNANAIASFAFRLDFVRIVVCLAD